MTENQPKLDKIIQIANRGRKDYYFFCKYILGYSKMSPVPHQELCDFVEKSKKRKNLILMPRGSFKSSCVTVGYTLWRLINDPNLRVLIAGETQKNAKKFVGEVKAHFEMNPKLRACYGNWVNKAGIWREDEFVVNRRTAVKKESSVFAASLEKQATTGQHYDLILLDDPVSMNNINTPEQLNKTLDFYRILLSVLDPGRKIIIIGTRYSAMDLYGTLMADDSGMSQDVDVLVKEADTDDGDLLMPKVLSREFLDGQRSAQGDHMYNLQYRNKHVSKETCYFDSTWVKYYKDPPPGVIYFMTVDPALSTKARTDYTGIIVNSVDYRNHWYVVEALRLKLMPSDLIDKMFELHEKYNFMSVGMEKFTLEQMLKTMITAEGEKRNMVLPIKDVPTDNRISKPARIRALQPKFQKGEIHIKEDQKDLQFEILNYPLGVRNDDLLDALKSQLTICFPSDVRYEVKKEVIYDKLMKAKLDDIKKAYRRVNRKSKYRRFI